MNHFNIDGFSVGEKVLTSKNKIGYIIKLGGYYIADKKKVNEPKFLYLGREAGVGFCRHMQDIFNPDTEVWVEIPYSVKLGNKNFHIKAQQLTPVVNVIALTVNVEVKGNLQIVHVILPNGTTMYNSQIEINQLNMVTCLVEELTNLKRESFKILEWGF